jgi:hypothetical protein
MEYRNPLSVGLAKPQAKRKRGLTLLGSLFGARETLMRIYRSADVELDSTITNCFGVTSSGTDKASIRYFDRTTARETTCAN